MRSAPFLIATAVTLALAASAAAAPHRVRAERRDLHPVLAVPATVAPSQFAAVISPAFGLIKQVNVDLAWQVKKGQVLATLVPRAGKPVVVQAPFDGVVIESDAVAGVFVAEGAVLFNVVDIDNVRIELEIPEIDVSQVKVGQELSARFEAYPDKLYTGRVQVCVPLINARTRTEHADGVIENRTHSLLPGMSGMARIALADRSQALVIPAAAVGHDGQRGFVYRPIGGHAVKTPLALGLADGDWVEVSGGLQAGDEVLVGVAKDGEAVAP